MVKLIVLNSFGPMGSTLLSSLLEKMKFTNIPLRKLGLHQYLMGEKDLSSSYMQKRLEITIKSHSIPARRGGVSVLDRNNQKKRAILDATNIEHEIEQISAKSIQDLYLQCRKIYCNHVIYKEITTNDQWHVELTTDIHRFNHKKLCDAYIKHFDEVYMIHLHRPFPGWINALASQAFVHRNLKNRIKFFPHMRYTDYALYEEATKAIPGLHIQFDEMFDTPINELTKKLSSFLKLPTPLLNLQEQKYDLYGKIIPYQKAFTRFDDNIVFLQEETKNYLSKIIKNNKIKKFPYNAFSWFAYLRDLLIYHRTHEDNLSL